jgi:hypothetical protein
MHDGLPNGDPANGVDPEDLLRAEVIAECTTLTEAQMCVSLLGSFGIPATIDAENFYRMIGGMAPGPLGIRVRVRGVDREAAQEILAESPAPPEDSN